MLRKLSRGPREAKPFTRYLHIHCLVPGAGLNERGNLVRVAQAEFPVYLPHLRAAFRQLMRRHWDARGWQVDPQVWTLDWCVQIQPVSSGPQP